ncbi:MAG: hypothetical protein Q7J34_12260 [Bacteroidales bacterium]|jgi:hypothetical protein|nr:hypothetical protein [Bacteroidales bacterium]
MRYFLLFIVWFSSIASFAQSEDKLTDSLARLSARIYQPGSDEAKMEASSKFRDALLVYCQSNKAFKTSLSKIKSLGILQSPAAEISILNWNIPIAGGKHFYQGILFQQINDALKHWYLNDSSEIIAQPSTVALGPQNWYGALYYSIIPSSEKKITFYTLLGWDGNNLQVARKIIDILWFDESGNPVFGKQVFGGKRDYRIIYEYAQGASFALRYDEQAYYRKRWWSRKPVQYSRMMILHNRLVSSTNSGKSLPQFVFPAGNILDAWIQENGKWKFIRDVDARNPESLQDKNPAKPPQQGLKP